MGGPGGLGPHLTELQVVSGELPLLVVGQLGGIDERVIVALVALNDLPAHLILGLLQRQREEACGSQAWRGLGSPSDPRGQGKWTVSWPSAAVSPYTHGTESPAPSWLGLTT